MWYLDNLRSCANFSGMDPRMRKILGKDGSSFGVDDPRPRPMQDGAKAGGGGIKITVAEIPPGAASPRRYPFKIEGTAPSGVVLSDVVSMLEARFQGDPKFNLRHSQDEAVQRLKERMEKRLESLKTVEDRAARHAEDLEAKRAAYEATKEEIKVEALRDIAEKRRMIEGEISEAEHEASRLRQEIQELRSELTKEVQSAEDRKRAVEAAQDRVLRSMGTDSLDEPFLSKEQAGEMAVDLVHAWRELLDDPEEPPMLAEYNDLVDMFAKLLSKTVGRVNDKWRDAGRPDPVLVAQPKKDPGKQKGSGGSLF